MDNITVPFGKYKNKNVVEFLADTQYVNWAKNNCLEKYKNHPI
jgi:uncharacterized protein (DUF3820 family)